MRLCWSEISPLLGPGPISSSEMATPWQGGSHAAPRRWLGMFADSPRLGKAPCWSGIHKSCSLGEAAGAWGLHVFIFIEVTDSVSQKRSQV